MRDAHSGRDRLRGAGVGRGRGSYRLEDVGQDISGLHSAAGGLSAAFSGDGIAKVASAGVIRIDKKTGEIEERWVDMADARRLFDLCLDVHLAAAELG